MSGDHYEEVIKNLIDSGFSAEMKALSECLGRQWTATGGASYFDLDERKSREFDLDAFCVIQPIALSAISVLSVIGEVKRSTGRPWVIFRDPEGPIPVSHTVGQLVVLSKEVEDLGRVREFIHVKAQLSHKMKWSGYAVHEAHKSPGQPSQWYKAFVTVCKAAASKTSWANQIVQNNPRAVVHVRRVVILDGPLLTATLKEDGTIHISEENMAPVRFSMNTTGDWEKPLAVDVVRLSAFGSYLDFCTEVACQFTEIIAPS